MVTIFALVMYLLGAQPAHIDFDKCMASDVDHNSCILDYTNGGDQGFGNGNGPIPYDIGKTDKTGQPNGSY